jgi:hypothetical protein
LPVAAIIRACLEQQTEFLYMFGELLKFAFRYERDQIKRGRSS